MTKPGALGSLPSSSSSISTEPQAVKKLPRKHENVDPAIIEAAQGMEALFLDYMMRVMRQTVPKNDMDLESSATEIYRSMLDSEVAERTAKNQGVGLADQLIDYLDSSRYTQIRNRPSRTGGTNAGQ